jgi:hypothetical protein
MASSSVVDPDPYPDPNWQKWPRKKTSIKFHLFVVLDAFLRAESFMEPRNKKNTTFDKKKKKKNISALLFFIFSHQNPGSVSGSRFT